jgi:putative ATP-binding cassette transporter
MPRQLQSKPYTTWQLLKTFWQSEQRFFAYGLLIAVLIMTIGLVGLDVLITYWYNWFYDELQGYHKRHVYDLMYVFLLLAAIYIVVYVYRYYIQAFLGMRWRRWMTDQFIQRWLSNRSYYYLETFDKATDNPDQRIQEDLGLLVTLSLGLLIGLISSIATIFAFIYVLWKLSGMLQIPLGSWGQLDIPGYLAWVGVIYAMAGTYLTFKIGFPLINLNFQQQRLEADFRFAAVDVRTHSESVALYRGEHHQNTLLDRLVDKFISNWYLIILRQKLLYWFTSGYAQIAVILPLVVALPNYFSKAFMLGGFFQTLAAFRQVQDALSYFVNAYPQIAEWRAVNKRLITFLNHMYEIEQSAASQNHLQFENQLPNRVDVYDTTIFKPNNTELLENISQEFIHGKNYLIKGVSGIGKSTFVRTVAGIWPFVSGKITLPEKQKLMYLPQNTYMPLGTFEEALLFPDHVNSLSQDKLKDILLKCGLPELTDRLNETAMWSQQLSPGEQQRIGFARVLIHKPDWVFLDESTSSLDLANEKRMYEVLKKELPHCSIISVGHRPSLESYHDVVIDFEKYSATASIN